MKVKDKILKLALKEFKESLYSEIKDAVLSCPDGLEIHRIQGFLNELRRITSEYKKDPDRGE
jgi:hypothetical protein